MGWSDLNSDSRRSIVPQSSTGFPLLDPFRGCARRRIGPINFPAATGLPDLPFPTGKYFSITVQWIGRVHFEFGGGKRREPFRIESLSLRSTQRNSRSSSNRRNGFFGISNVSSHHLLLKGRGRTSSFAYLVWQTVVVYVKQFR